MVADDTTTQAFGVKTLADRIGLSPGMIRKEIKQGRIDAIHCGRRVLVPATSVAKYLNQKLKESM